jgi:hypothetical protein
MFKTQLMSNLSNILVDLEINVTRSVINPDSYKIKNGLVSNTEIDNLRNDLTEILKTLDDYLFNHVDDGR